MSKCKYCFKVTELSVHQLSLDMLAVEDYSANKVDILILDKGVTRTNTYTEEWAKVLLLTHLVKMDSWYYRASWQVDKE